MKTESVYLLQAAHEDQRHTDHQHRDRHQQAPGAVSQRAAVAGIDELDACCGCLPNLLDPTDESPNHENHQAELRAELR